MVKRKVNELDELKRFFESKFDEMESRSETISDTAGDRTSPERLVNSFVTVSTGHSPV